MPDDPLPLQRRSIRLKGYDDRQAGAYFVTICTGGRVRLFGHVEVGVLVLDEAGLMIHAEWEQMPRRSPHVELDEFVVMPNPFHGIVVMVGAPLVAAHEKAGCVPAHARPGLALGDVFGAFKSITANRYVEGIRDQGWMPFPTRLWQRNDIIRSDADRTRIRRYMGGDPACRPDDPGNPTCVF